MSALTAATTTAFLFIFGNTIRHDSSPRNRVKFTASDWYYHTKGVRKSSEASCCTTSTKHNGTNDSLDSHLS